MTHHHLSWHQKHLVVVVGFERCGWGVGVGVGVGEGVGVGGGVGT